MITDTTEKQDIKDLIRKFLKEFCRPDRRDISEEEHETMMDVYFYYVDDEEQGWYVLDDPELFHRDLTQAEYWIYGELWEKAVAY